MDYRIIFQETKTKTRYRQWSKQQPEKKLKKSKKMISAQQIQGYIQLLHAAEPEAVSQSMV